VETPRRPWPFTSPSLKALPPNPPQNRSSYFAGRGSDSPKGRKSLFHRLTPLEPGSLTTLLVAKAAASLPLAGPRQTRIILARSPWKHDAHLHITSITLLIAGLLASAAFVRWWFSS